MPIAFPPPPKSTILTHAAGLFGKVPGIQVAPNLMRIGSAFTASTLDPGLGRGVAVRPNLRQLGKTYGAVTDTARVNPVVNSKSTPIAQRLTNNRIYNRVQGSINLYMSGVTRDTNGAVLGGVRVMIFTTSDMAFVGEVTSDSNGVWSILLLKGGPFFQVCYKAGSPDVAGTSVNTLVPILG
jgi:hypothetical protein